MSLAETYSAATASMVVSPATTSTACIGAQAVGVIAPENVPLPAALADPPRTRTKTAAAAARTKTARRGWCFTWPPRYWVDALTAPIYRDIEEFKREFGRFFSEKLTDESINTRRRRISAHAVEQDVVKAICELVGVRARPEPGICPVGGRQQEERRRCIVEI